MLFAPVSYQRQVSPSTINKYTALFGLTLRVADPLIVVATGLLAYGLRFGSIDLPLAYDRALARGMVFGLLVFSASPLYRSWRGRGIGSELATMVATYAALWVFAALYISAFKLSVDLSRLWRGIWFLCAVGAGIAVRLGVRGAAGWIRARGLDLRRAVVVGTADSARRVVAALDRKPWAGIQPVAWFGLDAGEVEAARRTPCGSDIATDHWTPVPCLGGIEHLADYVEMRQVNQVWIALPLGAEDEIACVLMALANSTADIKFVPDVFGVQLLNHSVEQVAGLPVLNLRASPHDGNARLLKAIEDRLLASAILLLIAPLLALIALGVKLSSPGPVLFRQKRHGLDGKVIEVWKFRSMR
ncbi:MAG: sugar transferase, partial [Lysobacteraceae bacterium]